MNLVQINVVMIQQKAIDKITLRLRVEMVYAPATSPEVIDRAKKSLLNILSGIQIEFVDKDPLAVFFITGGSEKSAIESIGNKTHVLLLAFADENAYAAATEVKAYLGYKGIRSWLCNLSDGHFVVQLRDMIRVWTQVRGFTHKRIGIIGKPSDWLVFSKPSAELIKSKFGIRLRVFPWEEIGRIDQYPQSRDFLDYFDKHGYPDFETHSRINFILQEIIHDNKLDGIAVECFSLIRDYKLTACLSLSYLNSVGVPSACEGDLVSLTGMMFIQNLTGIIPWMANLSGVFKEHAELSHCTVATPPLKNFHITSHFESGIGLAVSGQFNEGAYTLFRWNQHFDQAFVAAGILKDSVKKANACRTQMTLTMDSADLLKLQNSPLGNHHLIIPGDHTDILKKACDYLNISVI